MTSDDHGRLLDALDQVSGRVMLSGYHSGLYDKMALLCGWNCHERTIDNKASSAKVKAIKTECVWTIYDNVADQERPNAVACIRLVS